MREDLMRDKRMSVVWPIVSLCVTIAIAILFDFFPQYIGHHRRVGDSGTLTSYLTTGFRGYLPALNLCWAAIIGLNVAHLVLRRWTLATWWIDLGVHVFSAAVLFLMAEAASAFVIPSAVAEVRRGLILIGALLLIRPARWLPRLLHTSPPLAA